MIIMITCCFGTLEQLLIGTILHSVLELGSQTFLIIMMIAMMIMMMMRVMIITMLMTMSSFFLDALASLDFTLVSESVSGQSFGF